MAKKKSSKKNKRPKVPSAPSGQQFNTSDLSKPMSPYDQGAFFQIYEQLRGDLPEITRQLINQQLQAAPAITEAERQKQDILYRNALKLQEEGARKRVELEGQLAPQMVSLLSGLSSQANPEFMPRYTQLSNLLGNELGNAANRNPVGFEGKIQEEIFKDLWAGRALGPDLDREIGQAFRGAQTARGNYLGPAPTAQEAFGKGIAAENLYQQRLGRAQDWANFLENRLNTKIGQTQNFLNSKQPSDLWGSLLPALSFSTPTPIYPNVNVDTGLGVSGLSTSAGVGANLFGTQQEAATSLNNALLQANRQNNDTTFQAFDASLQSYDRSYEQYLERLALQNGILSTPGLGGGGGMLGGLGGIGGLIGAAGSGIATGVGALAAGGGATAAIGGGLAAGLAAF